MNPNGTAALDESISDYTAQERAALTAFYILEGAEMTTAEIAERVGLTHQGAWSMMQRVARVVPVYQDEGRWRRFDP